MMRYLVKDDGRIMIAKASKIYVKRDVAEVRIHYSEVQIIPYYTTHIMSLLTWKNVWHEFNTEGKKNIIRKKFE